MGWDEVKNNIVKGIDSKFMSCEMDYELSYIKKLLKEEFPAFSDDKIDSALKACCDKAANPKLRDEYIRCLQKELEGNG